MPVVFYRYISYQPEVDQIINERKVQSTNPKTQYATWYAPTRYDDSKKAQRELSLKNEPTHRVGPIPSDKMPDFEIGLRPVAPAFGQPGGGIEACTKLPIWLFGLWNFQENSWDL